MENEILIQHETNNLYRQYKEVQGKVEGIKASYVDLVGKEKQVAELYESEKLKLRELLERISGEKLAWATEKAEEMKVIEDGRMQLKELKKLQIAMEDNERKMMVEKEEIIEKIRENNKLILQIKSEQTANRVILVGIENKKKDLAKDVLKWEEEKKIFKKEISNLMEKWLKK